MDRGSFVVYIKTENVYVDIKKSTKTRFGTLNYELDRLLTRGKNKNVIGLIKEELGGKIKIDFATLIPKTYCF